MAKAIRRYGVWAGNRKGSIADMRRCVVSVHHGPFHASQCSRKRGHGPGRLYCKQHHPATAKAREEAKLLRWKKKEQMFRAPYLRAERYRRLGRKLANKILDGNCPCSCQSCIASMAYARKLLAAE